MRGFMSILPLLFLLVIHPSSAAAQYGRLDINANVKADVTVRSQPNPVELMLRSTEVRAARGRAQAEADLLKAQTELVREQVRSERVRRQTATGEIALSEEEFTKAWASVRHLYGDMPKYRDEMARLITVFRPGDVDLEDYIEGLYVPAKYSNFSKAPSTLRRNPLSVSKSAGTQTQP